MEWLARQLVLHGSLVLLVGFVGGCFFARAIKVGQGEVAWRVVHSGSAMAGIMLIALGPALLQLALPLWAAQVTTWTLILGTELFVVGMVLAAFSGGRGLSRRGSAANRVVWVLYMGGIALTLIGCSSLLCGAARALYA